MCSVDSVQQPSGVVKMGLRERARAAAWERRQADLTYARENQTRALRIGLARLVGTAHHATVSVLNVEGEGLPGEPKVVAEIDGIRFAARTQVADYGIEPTVLIYLLATCPGCKRAVYGRYVHNLESLGRALEEPDWLDWTLHKCPNLLAADGSDPGSLLKAFEAWHNAQHYGVERDPEQGAGRGNPEW